MHSASTNYLTEKLAKDLQTINTRKQSGVVQYGKKVPKKQLNSARTGSRLKGSSQKQINPTDFAY